MFYNIPEYIVHKVDLNRTCNFQHWGELNVEIKYAT